MLYWGDEAAVCAHQTAMTQRLEEDRLEDPRRDLPVAPGTTSAQLFRAVYEAQVGAVYRYICSKVGSREEAEDLTAQVFTKAIGGLDFSRDTHVIQSWLFQVARTTIADHWRAVGRMRTISLDLLTTTGWEGPAAHDAVMPDDAAPRQLVAGILAQLPPHYQEVLRCRFLLGFSLKETAQRMGLTEGNVKVLQFRALKRAAALQRAVVESDSSKAEVPGDGQ